MGRTTLLCAVGSVCVFCLIAPPALLADWYDNFDDGQYCQDPNDPCSFDPNLWDVDNPHWTMWEKVGTNFQYSAASGALELSADLDPFLNLAWLDAGVYDGDNDPNTSASWFDASADHYILAKVKLAHPNNVSAIMTMYHNPQTWEGFGLKVQWSEPNQYLVVESIKKIEGFELTIDPNTRRQVPFPNFPKSPGFPNDPNDPDYMFTEFWALMQFMRTDAGGTVGHGRYWGSIWSNDKFENFGLYDPNSYGNYLTGFWSEPYLQGTYAVGMFVDPNFGPAGGQIGFDQVECRWGRFTGEYHDLGVSVKKPAYGDITIDPDLMADPNDDPNQLASPRRYSMGTAVVLTATPKERKAFKKWMIFDPNYPGDANYTSADTNSVLYMTMDADHAVKGIFKCGGNGMLGPFVWALLALGLGVVIRRMH